MIVIAIIATLSAIAIPNFIRYRERALEARAISEVKQISTEIILFQIDTGDLPLSLADIGLNTLLDPWKNPYQYLNFETVKGKGQMRKDHNLVPVNSDFDLYSMGSDGKSQSPFTANASRDDIVRANDGQYVGSVSNY
jgi:general secretion pathway protein G